MLNYSLLRPLLFRLDAETAHALSLSALHYLPQFCFTQPKAQPFKAMGITFPHPVGLAAGLDKNGDHLDALAKLGFSFIELGTVTPKAQVGNPKPRLFRLIAGQAIINRMGFNNQGVDALIANVKKSTYQGVLGLNIGKNKETALNHAAEDYLHCLRKVYEYAAYITINISSPNTPDLRQLQQKEYLDDLLWHLMEEQKKLADQHQKQVPLVVKISPDESPETLKQMTTLFLSHGIEGIIATNTTCSRELVQGLPDATEIGGLSGKPLAVKSTQCLALLKSLVGDDLTLIGAGGITDCHRARKNKCWGQFVAIIHRLNLPGPRLNQSNNGRFKTRCSSQNRSLCKWKPALSKLILKSRNSMMRIVYWI